MNPSHAAQLDLFGHVLAAYAADPAGLLDNSDLYAHVAALAQVPAVETQRVEPVGKDQAPCNTYARRVRWSQQTLKKMGLLQRVDGKRGFWELTDKARKELHPIRRPWKVLGFSTELGLAIWGAAEDVFDSLDVPITLCFTSPPYPLRKERAYGNVDARAIVEFLCSTLTPVIARLSPEGSLVLNLSNDIFEPGTPARSTYLERLTLALEDEFGLSLMDRLIWENPSKPPGPMQWASKTRQQLNVAYEPILWFAKDPRMVKSNNRRVLEPHTERHQRLLAAGGESRSASYGDGAYRLRPGSFAAPTAGRIPRNVIRRGHRCEWGLRYREAATALALPLHGAGMPYSVPEFLIRFLTDEGDLVADPFGGRLMTARAAESLDRRWITTETMLEYVQGGSTMFRGAEGFAAGPALSFARPVGERCAQRAAR